MPSAIIRRAQTTIDDSDPSIQYSGEWQTSGTANEFRSTAHGTGTKGSSMQYTFTGSSISVLGTVPDKSKEKTSPVSSYVVDGRAAVMFAPTLDSNPQYQVVFYTSPSLDPGQHTLVVTSNRKNGWLWIDSLIVAQDPPAEAADPAPDSRETPRPPSGPGQENASNPSEETSTTLFPVSQTTSRLSALKTTGSPRSGVSSSASGTNTIPPSPTVRSNSTSSNAPPLSPSFISFSPSGPSSTQTLPVSGEATFTSTRFPIVAVVGGIFGGLLLCCLIITFIFARRRRRFAGRRSPATPFNGSSLGIVPSTKLNYVAPPPSEPTGPTSRRLVSFMQTSFVYDDQPPPAYQ